ncbi:hypothetical protein LIER_05328 [Lithospermum erythrorhizon]|uniref:Uncharacterized protein n=1 Tax=Lithospermum erythrorhizon TaxID=34254 RepID=A0AAV3P1D1_LITER
MASPIRKSPEAVTPSVIPDNIIRDHVVEVSFSVSSQEHPKLVHIRESLESLVVEVAESHPPALPTLSIAQRARAILHTGASSIWACICDGLQGNLPRWY